MPARGEFTISEPNAEDTPARAPYWGSTRMTYAICAFLAMMVHHCMRSAVNYSILCMVAERPHTSKEQGHGQGVEDVEGCESANETQLTHQLGGDLPWSRSEEVMFQGIFYYGYIVTMPVSGLLTDRYGGKIFFVYSIVLESVLFMLIPLCARVNFGLAGLVRVLQGLTAGCGNPALYQLFTVWAHPSERTAALAFAFSGFNVGNLLVFPLCSYLCKLGWHYVYYVIGSVSFVVGILFQFLVFSSIESHPRISNNEYLYLKAAQKPRNLDYNIPWRSILTSLPVYVFIFTHFFHTYGASMEALMLSRYLKEAMRFPLEQVGNLASIIFMGAFASKIITFIVGCKYESKMKDPNRFRKNLHLVCNLIAVLFTIAIIFLSCQRRWFVVISWTLLSISTDIAFAGAYWPSVIFMAPSYSGFIIGVANCIGTTSAFLVPIIIATVAPQGTLVEWDHVIIIMGVMYLCDALAFGLLGSSELQPWGLKKETSESQLEDGAKITKK